MSDYRESIGTGGSGAGFIGIVRLQAGSDYQLVVGAGGNSQGARALSGGRNGTPGNASQLLKSSTALISAGGGGAGSCVYDYGTAGAGGTLSVNVSNILSYSLYTNGNNGQAAHWTSSGGGSVGRTASVWSGHTYGSAADAGCSCGGGTVGYSHNGYGLIRFICADPITQSATPGSQSVAVPVKGRYEVIVVGGGGGSSNGGNAGAGAYWRGTVIIPANTTLSITIGAGGAGCPAYARNNSGYAGSASSVTIPGVATITTPGGEQSYNSRGANRGGYTYAPTLSGTYTTTEQSSQQLGRRDSWYGGYGTGGAPVGAKSAGEAGGSGYVCIRLLEQVA